MERIWETQKKLDELTQPGWGDMADYCGEREKMYGTSEWQVPGVVQHETADDAASLAPSTFDDPTETIDRVPGKWQML